MNCLALVHLAGHLVTLILHGLPDKLVHLVTDSVWITRWITVHISGSSNHRYPKHLAAMQSQSRNFSPNQ
jgi:hypothetical protein